MLLIISKEAESFISNSAARWAEIHFARGAALGALQILAPARVSLPRSLLLFHLRATSCRHAAGFIIYHHHLYTAPRKVSILRDGMGELSGDEAIIFSCARQRDFTIPRRCSAIIIR